MRLISTRRRCGNRTIALQVGVVFLPQGITGLWRAHANIYNDHEKSFVYILCLGQVFIAR